MHPFFIKDDANLHSHCHSVFIEHVLNGKCSHFLADILNTWWMASNGDDPPDKMYSVMTPYIKMESIWPALSSFSAKIIEAQLMQEAQVVATTPFQSSVRAKGQPHLELRSTLISGELHLWKLSVGVVISFHSLMIICISPIFICCAENRRLLRLTRPLRLGLTLSMTPRSNAFTWTVAANTFLGPLPNTSWRKEWNRSLPCMILLSRMVSQRS
jgi:hypothetical protein